MPQSNLWQKFQVWRHRREERRIEAAKRKGPVREWIELVLSIALMVYGIRLAVVEAYRIPTGSMEKTLLVGDFLLVNKFVYGIRTPDWIGVPFTRAGFFVPFFRLPGFSKIKQGDILVFRYPRDPDLSYIKRCVAIEGQTVEVKDKVLYIDGKIFANPPNSQFISPFTYPADAVDATISPPGLIHSNRDNYGPVTVPPGCLFMMGDNRDNSADSRFWGFLSKDLVLGKAMLIYFSWDQNKPLYQLDKKIRWGRIGNLIR